MAHEAQAQHLSPMEIALQEAQWAADRGEVPVGAVILQHGKVIARAGNRTREWNDPTAHAEVIAIRTACKDLGSERLGDCDLYVTLEPCTLCATAISFARIRRLYFGTEDIKGGAVTSGVRFFEQPTCHHAPDIYPGISEDAARSILQDFFKARRDLP